MVTEFPCVFGLISIRKVAVMTTFESKLSIVLAVLVTILNGSLPAFCEESSAVSTTGDTAIQKFVETTNIQSADAEAAASTKTAEPEAKCGSEAAKSAVDGSKESRTEYLDCIKQTTGKDKKIAPLVQKKGNKPVVALVLGGGGTRGAAHVGVLRVLEKEGIKPDMVVGTSMGAIVGGFYCAGISVDKIEEAFRNSSLMKHFMTVSIPVRILLAPVLLAPRLFCPSI